ncbi:nucleoside hydrolase [Caldibacillus lycopersici]|uniref:Nucleoside hydrolase n=1 Tax=Perspicuibacillus lycopersici TaxID=1325689 RepID=A0AAE3LTZ0_9BACI|nr:nucleoside hydrolase [Perspicuibacillus lycopersici]MCU9614773.1 nucleoside hydrolase [Perspicuibacillus lycopersici]
MEKVILDVDTGIDDALAILLAIESKQLNILGITTVNGNVPLDYVVKNTKKVLKLADRNDIPVYRGANRPLIRESLHEFAVHGDDGLGGALVNLTVSTECPDSFAPDYIIQQARKHTGELTLIMVGPLTNLALAVRKEPEIANKIKQVVVMGGVVSEGGKGNISPTAEFNIYADAEAAKIVFHSGLPIKLVSLDVTMKTFLTIEDIEKLQGTKYYDFVLTSTEIYRNFSYEKYGQNGSALHDPLTVGIVLEPSLVTTRKYFVDVETSGELTYGQTICDYRNIWNKEPNVEICESVDAERFISLFINTLKDN